MKAYNKAANDAVIEQGKGTGLKLTVEILGGNRCWQAMELNGKTFPFEDILLKSILPYKSCKRIGGCNCSYALIPQRGEDGKLINQQY